jgi:hypothetical protein
MACRTSQKINQSSLDACYNHKLIRNKKKFCFFLLFTKYFSGGQSRKINAQSALVGKPDTKDDLKNAYVYEKIILKWIFK